MDEALARTKVQKGLEEVIVAVGNNTSKQIIRRFKDLSKQINYDSQVQQESHALKYASYVLRSSNTFVLRDKRLIKGPQLDARNRLISENPKRKKKNRKSIDSFEGYEMSNSPSKMTGLNDDAQTQAGSKTQDNLDERRTQARNITKDIIMKRSADGPTGRGSKI